MHGDPKHPAMNPHPVKRYEVIATADAPGPWDSVKGYISYEVVNPACTPQNKFLGVHDMPQDVGRDIAMTKVDENNWKGYFYRDLIQDADYYGLGVCRWDATSVGGVFAAHSVTFGEATGLKNGLEIGSQTTYFRKSDFQKALNGDTSLLHYAVQDYSAVDNRVIQNPEVYFKVTVSVKETTP